MEHSHNEFSSKDGKGRFVKKMLEPDSVILKKHTQKYKSRQKQVRQVTEADVRKINMTKREREKGFDAI